jgi:pilus assembly protein CpaB
MRLVSILIVVGALVFAGAVFFVLPRFMNRNQVAQGQPQIVRVASQDVLVAAKPLAAGTVLKSDDVRWQRWPEEAIDPNFFVREKGADPQKVAIGLIVLRGIDPGQPVTALRLLKPGDTSFLAAALSPGMRAVTVKIDAATAGGGFILPQDRVDLLLTEHYTLTTPLGSAGTGAGGAPQTQIGTKEVSSVILRNLKVLAIDQGMQDVDSKPKLGATATLEVDLEQAQKVTIAASLGTLSLVLRSHTLPARAEPAGMSPIVEDYQVSPFRALALQQLLTNIASGQQQGQGQRTDETLHVYHGASLAGAKP